MINVMIITISKGQQITIPANIRENLGLNVGSKVEMEEIDGKIILRPIEENIQEIFKNAKKIKPKHGLNAKQMDELNEKVFK